MKDIKKSQIREIVRKNLIRFRKEKGVTQSDVGAYLGITKTGVASWEQGRTSPDIETIYLLSQYYRKSLDDFYEEEPVIASVETSRVLDPEKYILDISPEPVIIKTGDQYFELDVKALRRYQERKRKKNTDDRYSKTRKVLFDNLSEQNHHEEEG